MAEEKELMNLKERYVKKIEQIAEEKEMKNLFGQLYEGRKSFNELDARELKGLLKLIPVIRAKLEERKKQLNEREDDNVAN